MRAVLIGVECDLDSDSRASSSQSRAVVHRGIGVKLLSFPARTAARTDSLATHCSMASHQLAIAKASFSAGLLRPDPTSVTRDEITAFHSALDKALSHCSFANIQV